jgi:heptosyltransferase-3
VDAVNPPPKFSDRPRVLVITLRRLGDVLLTTPLVHALHHGLQGAHVDVLVCRGTEGILAANPDIGDVIAIPEKPGLIDMARLVFSLWRRYDLAITTQTGDRPSFLAWVAGRFRAGLVPAGRRTWRQLLTNRTVRADPGLHRDLELNRIALRARHRHAPAGRRAAAGEADTCASRSLCGAARQSEIQNTALDQ